MPSRVRSPGNRTSFSLTPVQSELLTSLTRYPLDSEFVGRWNSIVENIESSVADFIQNGLLEEATLNEKFDARFRVVDLKELLKRHNAKTTGKKSDLIDILLSRLPPSAAAEMVAGVRLYRSTPDGKALIDEHLEKKRQTEFKLESDLLACLAGGNVAEAGKKLAQHERQQVFPRGLGIDWSTGVPERYLMEADYLTSLRYDDLPLEEEKRRQVGACLALALLLGKGYSEASAHLLQATSGAFSCPVLASYLVSHPKGSYAADFAGSTDPASLAFLYAMTRMRAAHEHVSLGEIISVRVGKGVRISVDSESGCKTCVKGKHSFRWSEIADVPALPRHWGCDCSYEEWL